MPKDKSNPHLSSTRSSGSSPYSRPSENTDQHSSKSTLELVGDEGEWQNTICPICVEQPHNAVLLICSSHDKGCRPYMCDTSPRHSNCFEQFCQTAPPSQSVDIAEDFLRSSSIKKLEKKVQCPLCRGKISGWVVVEAARKLMNSKSRNCSLESCEFSGTYKELRKHARREHPSHRPTDPDPRRQQEWESEWASEDFPWAAELDNQIDDRIDLDWEDVFGNWPSESDREFVSRNLPSESDREFVSRNLPSESDQEFVFRNLPRDSDWEWLLRDSPSDLDVSQQLGQPGVGVYSGDLLDLDFALLLDSDLPLDMPYIFQLSAQEMSVINFLDNISGGRNSNEDQPQPGTNLNEDQVQPGSNSNGDQVQPDEREL